METGKKSPKAMTLEITDLKIKLKSNHYYQATCTLVLNNGLEINGIGIFETKSGIQVSWPINTTPLNGEARKELNNRILATYVVNQCCDEFDI